MPARHALLAGASLLALALAQPAKAQDATWLNAPGSGDFNTSANWTPATVPTGTAFFGTSGVTALSFSGLTALGGWTFNAGASNYGFTNGQALIFNGAGIVINGGSATIINNTFVGFNNAATAGSAAIINNLNLQFSNTATAGSAGVTNNNFLIFQDTSTAGSAAITNNSSLEFSGAATAGSATITGGGILFLNTATAGSAAITINNTNQLQFLDTSTAGSATITNNSGGSISFASASTASSATIANSNSITFRNTSSAGSAGITNNSGGFITFHDTSTAGSAGIANTSGGISFFDTSTAGSAIITNGGGGFITFNNTATAGSATITNNAGSLVNFFQTSTAGSAGITNHATMGFFNASTAGGATITNSGGGAITFNNTSTAGSAAITNNSGGIISFRGTSTAGSATITNSSGGFIGFSNTSTAGSVAITNFGVADFSGSTGPNNDHKLSAGSIAGGGQFYLGADQLTVGGNNLSTAVSGVISDCGAAGIACSHHVAGGALVKTGTGTLTLLGTNTYTGGTTISAGTLQLGNGGTSGSIVGNVLDNATLAFNRSDAVAFGSVISGSGAVTQVGTGSTTLSGANTYTGATTIDGGTLNVTGSIAASSLVSVNSGGALTGTGTVGHTAINNGGILAPGSGAAGTSLNIAGSLAFQSGAQYVVFLNPATASFANVTGTATLNGATVNAMYANGSSVSKQYTILTANSGVSGAFDGPVNTNLSGNFHTTLSYDANHAYLNLILNFAIPGGLNGSQQAVGNALTNFFNTNGTIPLVYSALTPNGLTQASGHTAAGSQQTTFDAMGQFLGLMTDVFGAGRESGASGPPAYAEEEGASAYASTGRKRAVGERNTYAMFTKAPPAQTDDPRWNVWAAGFGGSQTTDGNTAAGSNTTTSRIFGVVAGADYWFSPRTVAGFALAGGGTNFSVANGGTGRSDLFQAGAFVRHTEGAAYITAAAAYGWQDITTDRTVTIAGVDQLRARFDANAYSGRVEGGYRFVAPWIGGIGITPYAAAQATTFELPAYAEGVISGANTFALAYGAKSVTDTRSELGLRADKSYAMQNAVLTLRGRAAWAHDFDPDRAIGATFQALPGASFVVNGARQASDSALTTASAEMKWLNGWSAAATFEGEFSNVTRSYAGKGALRYAW